MKFQFIGGERVEASRHPHDSNRTWATNLLHRALLSLVLRIRGDEGLNNAARLDLVHQLTDPTLRADWAVAVGALASHSEVARMTNTAIANWLDCARDIFLDAERILHEEAPDLSYDDAKALDAHERDVMVGVR